MEMATGNSMIGHPTPQDYKSVSEEVKEILDFIFELQHSIQDVSILLYTIFPLIYLQ